MANPHNIQVGQELWFVPSRYGNERSEFGVKVEKVGRIWAEVIRYGRVLRIHLEDLHVDGGNYSSPGRVYLDRAVWDLENKQGELWSAIRKHIYDNQAPTHVTVEKLEEFLRLIRDKA